ncbi:hypothetical protein ACEWPL_010645 [Roseovarius sp. S1116L3]|uniref:hypothetical protein n=1 Tax=Roseovarius roseus TaxID=3342636 RepID=UPI00372A15EF
MSTCHIAATACRDEARDPLRPMIAGTGFLILVVASAAPFAARADCPKLAPVYGEIGASSETLDLAELGDVIATTVAADQGLGDIVSGLRARFPIATDPELANALIAAYCVHLTNERMAQEQVDRELAAFEDKAYNAVYPNAVGEPKKRGWLYSND